MSAEKFELFDAADYLDTPEDVAFYLEAAFEGNDPRRIAAALDDVARAKGMSAVAQEAGLTRDALSRALSDLSLSVGHDKNNPGLTILIGVFKALGLRLSCERAQKEVVSHAQTQVVSHAQTQVTAK